jgi:hypothetical protein
VSTSRVPSKAYSKHASKRVLLQILYFNSPKLASPANISVLKLHIAARPLASWTYFHPKIVSFGGFLRACLYRCRRFDFQLFDSLAIFSAETLITA